MANENNPENMNYLEPKNVRSPPKMNSEISVKAKIPNICEGSVSKKTQILDTEGSIGVAIKNIESESLNSLLVYDSDSSSSSEMMKLNLDWQVKNGLHDSTCSSSSQSSDDENHSESSSDDDSDDGLSPAHSHLSQNGGAIKKKSIPKTDEELSTEKLPPVPDLSKLKITVENESFLHMGNVLGIVDKLVTVAALPNLPAYDLDTLLFIDNGKRPLGFVFDVLGQVTSPIYAIRFNTTNDIKNLEIQIGTKVYSAPTSKHTQYVFLQQLLKMKGSDASWLGDNEVPPEFADFSDDENESFHRHGNKNLRAHVKRTHSSDSYKKFENTMNRRNILNTKFNKYVDSYKQVRLNNKAKSKRSEATHIKTSLPPFDPSVPPPNLGHHPMTFYRQPEASAMPVLPPECVEYMVYDMESRTGNENNDSGVNQMQGFRPNFFMSNFVVNLSQPNAASYFTNHVGNNLPGPSHE